MLVKPIIGTILHNARVWVGEIVLIFVAGSWLRWLRRLPPRPTLVLFGFFLAFAEFSLIPGLFGLVTLRGPGLQDRFGLCQVCQTQLPPCEFIRNDQPAR